MTHDSGTLRPSENKYRAKASGDIFAAMQAPPLFFIFLLYFLLSPSCSEDTGEKLQLGTAVKCDNNFERQAAL